MAFTKSEIATAVKQKLNRSDTHLDSILSSSDGIDLINEACDLIVTRTMFLSPRFYYPGLVTRVEKTLYEDTGEYDVQSDWSIVEPSLIFPVRIRIITSGKYRRITYIDPEKFFDSYPVEGYISGDPRCYTMDQENKITFGPTPASSLSIEFKYYHYHQKFEDGERHSFPTNELLINATCYLTCLALKQKDETREFWGALNGGIKDIITGEMGRYELPMIPHVSHKSNIKSGEYWKDPFYRG